MATIDERHDSREEDRGNDRSRGTLSYTVAIDLTTEDEDDAWALLDATAPTTFNALPLKSKRLKPQGAGIFIGEASYEDSPSNNSDTPKESGESMFRGGTLGGSVHLSNSLETIDSYVTPVPPPHIPPNFHTAINATKDTIGGVDIIEPKESFEVVKLFAASSVDALFDPIRRLTGKVNRTAITITVTNGRTRTFPAGSLRFDGANYDEKKAGLWEFVYKFTVEDGWDVADPVDVANGYAPVLVGDISVDKKEGWDYLWVHYSTTNDPASSTLVRRPIAVYIERVYKRRGNATFRDAGIPVP